MRKAVKCRAIGAVTKFARVKVENRTMGCAKATASVVLVEGGKLG